MRNVARDLISIPCLCLLLSSSAGLAQEQGLDDGTLEVTAIVIASDLALKPVPKWVFKVNPVKYPAVKYPLTTGFDGKASLSLPPSEYVIRSESPLSFEGRSFYWEVPFSVTPGGVVQLELSNDNALVEELEPQETSVELDEGDLYQLARRSVFKVLSESGHGSGFLVARSGLVLTNHHVVASSDYLAVMVAEGRKYPAKVLVMDDLNDVAVLQVNPSVVEQLQPLALAEDDPVNPPCAVGDRVLALGSPLATETILTSGLVSKIEEGAIYSDVSINPGNSGGPLFNMRGEVIGINTFRLPSLGSAGVAGIVRLHLALPLIHSAQSSGLLSDPPSAQNLPVESSYRFPADALRQQAMRVQPNAKNYHVEVGKFDVQLLTPVVVASLEVASEREAAEFRKKRSKRKGNVKEYKPGESFYEWRKYAGDYRPVVTVQAVPETTLTGGSVFAVAMLGASAPQRYKFKADFDRMELWRGGTIVQPIHPRRYTNVVDFQAGNTSMRDVGYYGSYEYPPEAFRPGTSITLRVWKQGDPRPIIKVVPPDRQQRVWAHFLPYFEALEREVREEG